MKKVLEKDGGDGSATISMDLMLLNWHKKMVKKVNVMLCVFYLNKIKIKKF